MQYPPASETNPAAGRSRPGAATPPPRAHARPGGLALLAALACTDCAAVLVDSPQRLRVDARTLPVPIMLNAEEGGPAGRTISAVSFQDDRSSSSSIGNVTYYQTQSATSLVPIGAQLGAAILRSDAVVRIKSIVYEASIRAGFGTSAKNVSLRVEGAAHGRPAVRAIDVEVVR